MCNRDLAERELRHDPAPAPRLPAVVSTAQPVNT